MLHIVGARALAAGASLFALFAGAEPASAQVGANAGEIIVTARRRDERLQDVPESVTVFTAQDVERAGIGNLRDVADLTPNFSMLDNFRPGLERFQMRGLITPQVGDPPLAFVFDGVTAPDPEFVNQELFDIERIEVLRGAQGALYGRSAVGGAVNIVTRQPADETAGSLRASYGAGESWRTSAVLSGPIVADRLHFRVGAYYNVSDGLIENVYLRTGADYLESTGAAALLKWRAGARTEFDVRGQYANATNGMGYYDAVVATRASLEDFSIEPSQNVLGVEWREVTQLSARMEHAFDFATLTVAGAYAQSDDDSLSDADNTALPGDGVSFFPASQRAELAIEARTFEGRLTSNGAGRLSWALGGFYQERTRESSFSVYDDPSGVAPVTPADVDPSSLLFAIVDNNRSRAWALSAQASYKLSDALELTAAGRYDRDERRSFDRRDIPTTFASAVFDEFQPKFSLSYRLNHGLLVYSGYSRGFRSGGFNEYSPVVARIYGAESTDSYELGFKFSGGGGAFTLNGALFRSDQEDAQITRFNPASFTLENVAIDDVRAQGAELELAARLTEQWRVRLNAGYTDSEIRSFAQNPAVVGAAMPYVAAYNLALSADYERPLTEAVTVWGYAAYRRSGPRSFTLDFPDLKSEAHDFVDLRAGLRGARWSVAAFIENAFDERQPEDLFGMFNGAVELARQPNMPRRYGVELRRDF
jgi:iron complex outermembrane receptor protein